MKVRVCPRCRALLEEGYKLTSISLERYLEGAAGGKKRDVCDQCRKSGRVLACFEAEVIRRS